MRYVDTLMNGPLEVTLNEPIHRPFKSALNGFSSVGFRAVTTREVSLGGNKSGGYVLPFHFKGGNALIIQSKGLTR